MARAVCAPRGDERDCAPSLVSGLSPGELSLQLPLRAIALVGCCLLSTVDAADRARQGAADRARQGTASHDRERPAHERLQTHESAHFVLHTDLDDKAAAATLERMESALKQAMSHWRRRPRGKIRSYVAQDVDQWPPGSLPHPHARTWINRVDGATIVESGQSQRLRSQATIFSSTRSGVLEHEVIHAYCAQAFGRMGPAWYKEGMAVLASGSSAAEHAITCSPAILATLRDQPRRSVEQIMAAESLTTNTYEWLAEKHAAQAAAGRDAGDDVWTDRDAADLAELEQEYYWSWSLCYLLHNNPNYQRRFRALGSCYLAGHHGAFERIFGPVASQIAFEHAFLMDHLQNGFRADLCRWDWRKPHDIAPGDVATCRVDAARGFQATGVRILPNVEYEFEASGEWSTSASGAFTNAHGEADGSARLVAVIQRDFSLFEPFELDIHGSFVSPVSGQLYVRCRDGWNELADNRGHVRLLIRRL